MHKLLRPDQTNTKIKHRRLAHHQPKQHLLAYVLGMTRDKHVNARGDGGWGGGGGGGGGDRVVVCVTLKVKWTQVNPLFQLEFEHYET